MATDSDTFVITAPSITVGFITDTASVALGGTFKFQPYAVGSVDRTYTLQINGVTGGSLGYGTIVQDSANAGPYTAPSAMPMTGSVVTITVVSNADPTKKASATVTLHLPGFKLPFANFSPTATIGQALRPFPQYGGFW